MASFTENLLNGLGALLASPRDPAAEHPLTWRETGNYQTGESGIWVYLSGQAHKKTGVAIRAFGGTDDPTLSDSNPEVQLDFYGTPREVVRMVDDAFNLLHGRWGGTIGGVKIQLVTRTSGAVLGQDEAGNLRQTENYSLAVFRPSPNRQ